MCARLCAFLKKDMFYNIKICYNAEKWMRYAICVQNLCRFTSYLCNIENNRGILCRICAELVQKLGNKIWNKNKNKKGVKLIAATLSRHVASP